MINEMAAGHRYRIVFRRQPSIAPLIAVLDYEDEVDDRYVMSGRPILGVQHIPRAWVIDIEEVSLTTTCKITTPRED